MPAFEAPFERTVVSQETREAELFELVVRRGVLHAPAQIVITLVSLTPEGEIDRSVQRAPTIIEGADAAAFREIILDAVCAGKTAEALGIAGQSIRDAGASLLRMRLQ